MSALVTQNLVKRFGGVTATDNVTLTVEPGELHAIIGPNGAGKSTLIGQLAGEIAPDSGSVALFGETVTALQVHQRAKRGLARTYQITQLAKDFTALDNVLLAVNARATHNFRFWRNAHDDSIAVERALAALSTVGLSAQKNTPVATLAHGEQRQLEIAMALATEPKLLLLDEPLAGMSQGEATAMIALLKSLKGRYPMLLVEHDMDAVFSLADRVSVLVYGRIIATDLPANIRSNPEVRAAYLGDEVAA
ncbi:MAG: ABC transporter ATP-binding protein [Betaproteobacteria bacterium]|nr:MAG: ABC transporter ATP-binding protein [Betaproteobacteria bacterium]